MMRALSLIRTCAKPARSFLALSLLFVRTEAGKCYKRLSPLVLENYAGTGSPLRDKKFVPRHFTIGNYRRRLYGKTADTPVSLNYNESVCLVIRDFRLGFGLDDGFFRDRNVCVLQPKAARRRV